MTFIKSKQQVVDGSLGSVNEQVFKMGDTYKVKTVIDIPKSVINAFVSKAKKEHGIDPKENWSDTDLAELMVKYVISNYVNIDSLPVEAILGELDNPDEASEQLSPDDSMIEPSPIETPENQEVSSSLENENNI